MAPSSPEAPAPDATSSDTASLPASTPNDPHFQPSLPSRSAMNIDTNTGPSVPAAPPMATIPMDISAADVELYDRQIRLWGMTAQKRIAGTRVLAVNHTPLLHEVLKNLVLAGVASVTLSQVPPHVKTTKSPTVLGSTHSPDMSEAANSLSALNPRVSISCERTLYTEWQSTFMSNFDVVLASGLPPKDYGLLNTMARLNNIPFYASDCYGMYGFIFSDLIEHTYTLHRPATLVTPTIGPESRTRSLINYRTAREDGNPVEYLTKKELFSTWLYASSLSKLPSHILSVPRRKKKVSFVLPYIHALWKFRDDTGLVTPNTDEELAAYILEIGKSRKTLGLDPAPLTKKEAAQISEFLFASPNTVPVVAATLGGQLAQDVINMRAGNQVVIQNLVVFNGWENSANVYSLHPEGDLGPGQIRTADPVSAVLLAEGLQQQSANLNQGVVTGPVS